MSQNSNNGCNSWEMDVANNSPCCQRCKQSTVVRVSHTEKNPLREFYSCKDCKLFNGWCDEINFKPIHLKQQLHRYEQKIEEMTANMDKMSKKMDEICIKMNRIRQFIYVCLALAFIFLSFLSREIYI
jgi:CRISPR/Cas system CSM-associated protein Csm2 small subunit